MCYNDSNPSLAELAAQTFPHWMLAHHDLFQSSASGYQSCKLVLTFFASGCFVLGAFVTLLCCHFFLFGLSRAFRPAVIAS
jgi:hypothetical protein